MNTRTLVIGGAAVAALLSLSACEATTASRGSMDTPAAAIQSSTQPAPIITESTPDPIPSETPVNSSTFNLAYGTSITTTDKYGMTGPASATVVVNAITVGAPPPSDYNVPENGQFVVADVTYTGTQGTFDYNELEWAIQTPDGRTWDSTLGYFDPSLNSGELAVGQIARGNITFDVPAGPLGTLVYSTILGKQLASWTIS